MSLTGLLLQVCQQAENLDQRLVAPFYCSMVMLKKPAHVRNFLDAPKIMDPGILIPHRFVELLGVELLQGKALAASYFRGKH